MLTKTSTIDSTLMPMPKQVLPLWALLLLSLGCASVRDDAKWPQGAVETPGDPVHLVGWTGLVFTEDAVKAV